MSSTKATSQCRRGSKACQAKVIHKCPPRLLGFDGQLRCRFACLRDLTLNQQAHHWNASALSLAAAPSPGSLQTPDRHKLSFFRRSASSREIIFLGAEETLMSTCQLLQDDETGMKFAVQFW